jgi:hypothetical protein
MRVNSGSGKPTNNNLDPTLKEHEAEGGHRPAGRTPGDQAEIGPDADEDLSHDDRARGETSSADNAPPVDAGR